MKGWVTRKKLYILRRRMSTWVKVDLYEVCLSYFIYCLLFITTILTSISPARFVAFITPAARILESIGHKDLG